MHDKPPNDAAPHTELSSLKLKWRLVAAGVPAVLSAIFGASIFTCNYFVKDNIFGQIVVTSIIVLYPLAFTWIAYLLVNFALQRFVSQFFGEIAIDAWNAILITCALVLIGLVFSFAAYAIQTWPQRMATVFPLAMGCLGLVLGVMHCIVTRANTFDKWAIVLLSYCGTLTTFSFAITELVPSQ